MRFSTILSTERFTSRFLRSVPLFLLLLLLVAPAAFSAARGETEARDITAECRLTPGSNSKKFSRCLDRAYKTYWQSEGGKRSWIEIAAPEGETLSGVWLQWYDHPHAWGLQLPEESGGWADYTHTDGLYLSEYLSLPEGTTACRVVNAPGNTRRFMLDELRVYSGGETPREVQQFVAPAEKADLMLLVAHPDDEVLWFGGTLPLYAGERGKTCQICMMVPSTPYRRLELLDCLWTCGVKNYPVWGIFRDAYTNSLKKQYRSWDQNYTYKLVTGWIRRFKPEVLLTHDFNGEYGHGAHRVCADAVDKCLDFAANKKKYKESAQEYGTWSVPKCYIHLCGIRPIDMDWRQPLKAFDGKTGFEVAEAGFLCHVSQQVTEYRVEDFGPWDNSLFGLYFTRVGDDVEKNDFFEHLD